MTIADLVDGCPRTRPRRSGSRAYDGSSAGPADPPATIVVKSPDAIRRLVTAPGDLGFGRAYVAGDLDIEGDLFAALELRRRFANGLHLSREQWLDALKLVGTAGLRPLPPPPEEVQLTGAATARQRDAAAIAHHYDVSNDFYRIVLGPSMTYSCAVWDSPDVGLEAAQAAKYELICRKLDLEAGDAAARRRVRLGRDGDARGAAPRRAGGRRHRLAPAGRARGEAGRRGRARDQVEIRLQDYRDIHDGPYDAISSIGMFEHVGLVAARDVLRPAAWSCSMPEGRLLNHAISRPAAAARARPGRGSGSSVVHRPVRVPRRRAARGRLGRERDAAHAASRSATSRPCGSTTR